jgi:hypothetical protein
LLLVHEHKAKIKGGNDVLTSGSDVLLMSTKVVSLLFRSPYVVPVFENSIRTLNKTQNVKLPETSTSLKEAITRSEGTAISAESDGIVTETTNFNSNT